jgi:hypothetical protein
VRKCFTGGGAYGYTDLGFNNFANLTTATRKIALGGFVFKQKPKEG